MTKCTYILGAYSGEWSSKTRRVQTQSKRPVSITKDQEADLNFTLAEWLLQLIFF